MEVRGRQEVGKRKHLIGLQVVRENHEILWWNRPKISMWYSCTQKDSVNILSEKNTQTECAFTHYYLSTGLILSKAQTDKIFKHCQPWYILFLCAIELHCCPKMIKNWTQPHHCTGRHVPSLRRTVSLESVAQTLPCCHKYSVAHQIHGWKSTTNTLFTTEKCVQKPPQTSWGIVEYRGPKGHIGFGIFMRFSDNNRTTEHCLPFSIKAQSKWRYWNLLETVKRLE